MVQVVDSYGLIIRVAISASVGAAWGALRGINRAFALTQRSEGLKIYPTRRLAGYCSGRAAVGAALLTLMFDQEVQATLLPMAWGVGDGDAYPFKEPDGTVVMRAIATDLASVAALSATIVFLPYSFMPFAAAKLFVQTLLPSAVWPRFEGSGSTA
jgi:hypothetical protein